MNKKTIWGIVAVILIVVLVLVFSKDNRSAPSAYNVGAISALTGSASYYGVSTMKGIEIGKEEMKLKYPDLNLVVIHEDSMFTPKGGIDAYNKLRQANNIDAVITMASNVSVAVEPLAAKDGITDIAASTLANNFSTPNDLSFRMTAKGDLETQPILDFMKKKGLKKLAVIFMTNEIGTSLSDSLTKEASNFGVEIVVQEGYSPDTTDFRTILLKMKQSKPDVVYLASLATHSAQIVKQSDTLAFKPIFMSYRAAEDPVLISTAGILAENIIYTNAFDSENNSPLNQLFSKAYKGKYNEDVNGYAAEGYEAIKLIAESFKQCGKDYVCIQKYLASIKNRPSVLGNFSFDENGDVTYPFFLKTVREGKFVKYQE